MPSEFFRGEFCVSTDPARLDLAVIHAFLATTYWSPGIPREVVARAIAHSLCFGLYHQQRQIGFARVITDYTNHAYLADVFVLNEYRGQGLGRWLIECVVAYPELQGIRRMLLCTDDAHSFYQQLGFAPLAEPAKFMEKLYQRAWFKEQK